MDDRIIFWVEVSEQIATGHLMECLAVSDEIKRRGMSPFYVINPYLPAEEILKHKNIPYKSIELTNIGRFMSEIISLAQCNTVIINHRNVNAEIVNNLKDKGFKIVVIDEMGGKKINSDLLINGKIVDKWHNYSFRGSDVITCLGPEYTILRKEFLEYSKKEKLYNSDAPSVLVSLGGVDRSGVTLKVIEALRSMENISRKEIILGKGFKYSDMFYRDIRPELDMSFEVFQGVNNMAERIFSAEIAISSGGNTLYEIACLGTPGIVLWEDPHEKEQGLTFQDKGSAICLGEGARVSVWEIRNSIDMLLKDKEVWKKMSAAGKRLVVPGGVQRIVDKITDLISKTV